MWILNQFRGPVRGMVAPSGAYIAEIVDRAILVDPDLGEHARMMGTVTINGREVPRHLWSRVRVYRRRKARVLVTLHPGLGKDGGNVLATIAQLAAIVAAAIITGPIGVGSSALSALLYLPLGCRHKDHFP